MSGISSNGSSPESRTADAIIVAAGAGRRMGGVRKQYLEILGAPVLLRAIRPFLDHPRIRAVVVVLPEEDVAEPPLWLRALPVERVAGGAERADSVRRGLDALPPGADLVLVHDGARPFVTRALIDRVLERAPEGGAVCGLPATDTIKEVGEGSRIVGTLPRSRLWHAQTPQGFPVAVLREAHRRAAEEGWHDTDDAALCERCGTQVYVVEGDQDNIKITRPTDLPVAEAIARRAPPPQGRPVAIRDS